MNLEERIKIARELYCLQKDLDIPTGPGIYVGSELLMLLEIKRLKKVKAMREMTPEDKAPAGEGI